jgi:hypothetical protein
MVRTGWVRIRVEMKPMNEEWGSRLPGFHNQAHSIYFQADFQAVEFGLKLRLDTHP